MDKPHIRPAEPEDFGQILALWESIDRHVGLADSAEQLQRLHALSPDLFLVAESEGDIIGTLIAGWDGWRAQMARLATREDWRRRGVARLLVDEGERRLREHGAQRIYALVDRRSEPAGPFWEAAGYKANENIVQYSRNLPGSAR
jgi:predicted N-acetyltransferase YhbS